MAAEIRHARRRVLGFVDDAETCDVEVRGLSQGGRQFAELAVVVSRNEGERDADPVEEIHERIHHAIARSRLGVEEIPRDDEAVGLVFPNEFGKAREIADGIALGNRKAVGAEGGGFPEMQVGAYEDGFLTMDEQCGIRKEAQRQGWEIFQQHCGGR